jgi:hypothetical protein
MAGVHSWVSRSRRISYIKCTSDSTRSQEDSQSVQLLFHADAHVQGLPAQWSKLLTSSAITREEAARNPEAVLDVLQFYTAQQMDQFGGGYPIPSAPPPGQAAIAGRFAGVGLGGHQHAQKEHARLQKSEADEAPKAPAGIKQVWHNAAVVDRKRDGADQDRVRR